MMKLIEWIIFVGVVFLFWIILLIDILFFKVFYKVKEVIWLVIMGIFYERVLGFYLMK